MMHNNPARPMIFYLSMIISVISIIFYQLLQKSIAVNINPVVSVIITYSIAIIFSIMLMPYVPSSKGFLESLKDANYASYLLGIAVVGIEIGFLLVYRSGWKLGLASGFSSTVSTTILVLVGIIVFKEQLSPLKIIGLACCIAGMILVHWD